MKILILSMTCGGGHNAIANNLKDAILEINENTNKNEVEVFDIFGINSKKSLSTHNGYIWCTKHIPHLYNYFWNKIRNKNSEKRYSNLNLNPIKKVLDYNLNKINNFKPESIICTHNYASNICCILKKQGKINCKIYTVFHDYVACPFWETSILCDNIFTPTELCNDELLKRGYKLEQIVPLGFPINSKFQKELDRNAIREKLNINIDDFVLLSMAGGFGQANSLIVVKELQKIKAKNFKAIIVCGKNPKQKAKIDNYLKAKNITNIICYEFVTNIDELMTASDAFLTRGGNALNEGLLKGLIPIVREGVIANELLNKKLFIKHKVGLGLNKISDLSPLILNLMENPSILEEMKQNINSFIKKDACKNIVEFIVNNK